MAGKDNQSGETRHGHRRRDEDYPGADSSRGNQMRDEPIPASHHEERDQEAVVRNEEHAAGDLEVGPSEQADSE